MRGDEMGKDADVTQNYTNEINENKSKINYYENRILELEECKNRLGKEIVSVVSNFFDYSQLTYHINDKSLWNGVSRDSFEEDIPDIYKYGVADFIDAIEEKQADVDKEINHISQSIFELRVKNIKLNALKLYADF